VDEMFLCEESAMDGGLFGDNDSPDHLQRQLDAEAREIDRSIGAEDEEAARLMRETELMDYLITECDGQPIFTIFENPERLPKADDLSDGEAERLLKTLLGQMALFGIALDICEHCSPRDAYRFLVEEIAPEGTFHPEMRDTDWVQHFATSDVCPECEAEFEREFEEHERGETEHE